MFRSGRTRPAHARSSGSERLLRIRSLAGYIIGTLESRFRKRQARGGLAKDPRSTLLGAQDRQCFDQVTEEPTREGQARIGGDLDGRALSDRVSLETTVCAVAQLLTVGAVIRTVRNKNMILPTTSGRGMAEQEKGPLDKLNEGLLKMASQQTQSPTMTRRCTSRSRHRPYMGAA